MLIFKDGVSIHANAALGWLFKCLNVLGLIFLSPFLHLIMIVIPCHLVIFKKIKKKMCKQLPKVFKKQIFFLKCISMKFDTCSTHRRVVVIKPCRLQIQAVMLTNSLSLYFILSFFPEKIHVFLLLFVFISPLIIIYEACAWQIMLFHAFYFYKLIFLYKRTACYKTLQDRSHHCFTLQCKPCFPQNICRKCLV